MEMVWLLDNDRVNRWYYCDAPELGAAIRYVRDGYICRVDYVGRNHITLSNGIRLRRGYVVTRIAAWLQTKMAPSPAPRYRRGLSTNTPKPVITYESHRMVQLS